MFLDDNLIKILVPYFFFSWKFVFFLSFLNLTFFLGLFSLFRLKSYFFSVSKLCFLFSLKSVLYKFPPLPFTSVVSLLKPSYWFYVYGYCTNAIYLDCDQLWVLSTIFCGWFYMVIIHLTLNLIVTCCGGFYQPSSVVDSTW